MALAKDPFFEIVGAESLEAVAESIRNDEVRSTCIHNIIIMHAKEYSDFFDVYIQKSNHQCVLLIAKFNDGILCVYCPESEEGKFLKALNKTKLINWNIFSFALYVPETFCDKLSQLIIRKAGCEVFRKEGEFHIYNPHDYSPELTVPANYSVRKISVESAIQMENVAESLFVCPNISKYRELHVNAPNCCVYYTKGTRKKVLNLDRYDLRESQEDGVALAWACINKDGQLGTVCANEGPISELVGYNVKKRAELKERLCRLVVDGCTRQMVNQGFVVNSVLNHDLSPLPDMPDWEHVGQIESIHSRFSSFPSEDDCDETGEDEEESDEEDLGISDEAVSAAKGEEDVCGTDREGQIVSDVEMKELP